MSSTRPCSGAGDDGAHLVVDQGDEDDGPLAFALRAVVDLVDHHVALSTVSMKGRRTWRGLGRELVEDGIAEGFGGDAGAVGNEKNGSSGMGGAGLWSAAMRSGIGPS
jgi:hypothetical protein